MTRMRPFLLSILVTFIVGLYSITRCYAVSTYLPLGLVDDYAAAIPTLKFSPGVHVNYAETVLPMKDGLPKLKDFPAELGGSGVALPE